MNLSLSATNYKFRVGYHELRRFVKAEWVTKDFGDHYATLVATNTDFPIGYALTKPKNHSPKSIQHFSD